MARAVRERKKSKLGKAIEYLLIAGWFGLIFYGLPKGWGLLLAIVGAPVLYLIAGILAWLFNVPVPEPPADVGGAPEEDESWVSDPAYSCIPGNYYYSETMCNSSSFSDSDDYSSSSLDD